MHISLIIHCGLKLKDDLAAFLICLQFHIINLLTGRTQTDLFKPLKNQ